MRFERPTKAMSPCPLSARKPVNEFASMQLERAISSPNTLTRAKILTTTALVPEFWNQSRGCQASHGLENNIYCFAVAKGPVRCSLCAFSYRQLISLTFLWGGRSQWHCLGRNAEQIDSSRWLCTVSSLLGTPSSGRESGVEIFHTAHASHGISWIRRQTIALVYMLLSST